MEPAWGEVDHVLLTEELAFGLYRHSNEHDRQRACGDADSDRQAATR